MEKTSVKYNILWLIFLFAIFFETYRHFMSYSIVFRSYIYFLFWFILCFVLYNMFIRKINYIPVAFFLIVVVLYIFRGGDYFGASKFVSLIVGYIVFPTVVLFYNRFYSNRHILICLITIFITTTYTMVCTAPVAMFQPGLIRETGSNEELGMQLQQLGVMNYALPHSIIFIIPALCLGIRYCHSILIKLFNSLALVEIFVIVYFGEATVPLVLGLASFFISIIYNIHKTVRVNLIRLFMISLLFAAIMNEMVVNFVLSSIEPIFEGTAFAEKTHELQMSMNGGTVSGGDVEARQDYLGYTIDAIVESPLWGTTNKIIGGHNYFLDIFASIGVIGFFPLMVWIVYIIKKIGNVLPNYCRFYFFVGIATFIIHCFTKNVWGGEFFFYSFLLLPCLLLFFGRNIEVKMNEQIKE